MPLGVLTKSVCDGIARNLSEMMPAEFMAASGITRIVASGNCIGRNAALLDAVKRAYSSMKVDLAGAEDGASSAVGAALFVLPPN
jgi:hypothetical protein